MGFTGFFTLPVFWFISGPKRSDLNLKPSRHDVQLADCGSFVSIFFIFLGLFYVSFILLWFFGMKVVTMVGS